MKYFMSKKHTAFCRIAVLLSILASCSTGLSNFNENYASVKIKVFDSVCGEPIKEPSVLSVYEAGKNSLIYDNAAVVNGSVNLVIKKKQCYDFRLKGEKNKLSASVIENYYIGEENSQLITMIQREPQHGAETEAPSVTSVLLNGEVFTDGGFWYTNTSTQIMVLKVEFRSPVRPIQSVPSNGNFGCAFAVGSSPSARNSIAEVAPVCVQEADGSWKCTATFSLDEISFNSGVDNLVITAYDFAGNRVERHINSVSFTERRPATRTIQGASVQGFRVEMRRFPESLRLFGAEEESGAMNDMRYATANTSSHDVVLWFSIKDYASKDLPIRGFDIYRREQGKTNWVSVQRRQYARDYSGPQNLSPAFKVYEGFHSGYDTDSSLEEGVTYEYKISAFTDTEHCIESPVGTARLLPANTIMLESPADNGFVKKSELDDLSFSFRITNPSIWENKLANFFDFGLRIARKDSDKEIVFAGKITVDLNAEEGERLTLRTAQGNQFSDIDFKELKVRGLVAPDLSESDLLTYKDGVVTIHPKYLNTSVFNHPKYQSKTFETGYTYCWDIFDWGKHPDETYDDEPAVFGAIWNDNTSESFANGLRYASSANGNFYFKITDE